MVNDFVCKKAWYLAPAWKLIPEKPTREDMHEQLRHCKSEQGEVEEAVEDWIACPNNATFAHMAEEVCDCIVSNMTLLHLLERMEECPCYHDYAAMTMQFTYLKNKRRGYHD